MIAAALPLAALLVLTGNTHEPETFGPSILSWLVTQWLTPGSESSHGWLVPFVSMFFVWIKRREWRAAPKRPAHGAIVLILVLLVCYWAGYRTQQPRLGVVCLIGLTWTVPLYLWGWAAAKPLMFPCGYLVFAMPLGFLTAMTLPLRLLSSGMSTGLLNGLGVATRRIGTAIVSSSGSGFAMDVADPCSGLNSLIALTALTFAYAFVTQKTRIGTWLLCLCAVPLAVAGNVVRIVTIALVASAFGNDAAMKIYHDYSGYIVFVSATLLMVGAGTLIGRWFDREGAPCNVLE